MLYAYTVCTVERGGLDLAILSTLMRLLEVQVMRLEGEEGTGTLEQDLQLLSRSVWRGISLLLCALSCVTSCQTNRREMMRYDMHCCTESSRSSWPGHGCLSFEVEWVQ